MDEKEIIKTIHRFRNSFDSKNWDEMQSCLHNTIHIDYSSFRKTPAQSILKEEYVALRKEALQHLETEHIYQNIKVNVNNYLASIVCEFQIKRRTKNKKQYFNSRGNYLFKLTKDKGNWLISSIKQNVTHNEGNHSIHSGVKKE